jgi:hypothetical protein
LEAGIVTGDTDSSFLLSYSNGFGAGFFSGCFSFIFSFGFYYGFFSSLFSIFLLSFEVPCIFLTETLFE